MNCTTCRFELSQCLDGRLPSGRRAIVLEHAADCAECGTFWAELQAAQRLTLQLQRPRVGADFRDSLWQRIQAGEGTPEAVFHEPVPLLAKLRYALTGAAAAAAALLGVLWLTRGDATPRSDGTVVARTTPTDPPRPATTASMSNGAWANPLPPIDQLPLMTATKRLTFPLLAVETAKQLDQRYAAATHALRRLGDARAPDSDALHDVMENADEFQAFGELLLHLSARKRLHFIDADVEPQLRTAVHLLGQSRQGRDRHAVPSIVAIALQSDKLASVSSTISLPPVDERDELEVLRYLNSLRPEVFPKLFVVWGHPEGDPLFDVPAGAGYLFDDCGPAWVAPRSEVEVRDARLRISRRTRDARGGTIEMHVEMGK